MESPIFHASNEETERQGAAAMQRIEPEAELPYALERPADDDAPAPVEEPPPVTPQSEPEGERNEPDEPDERVNDVPGPRTVDEVP